MDVLIIEDELPAQQILIKLIRKYFPEFNIIGALDSVKAAAKYLQDNSPDLIFLDVELSDGKCFELFRQVDIRCPVIITTAYGDYALDAFKAKCLDYLMKPVDPAEFKESVERCLQLFRTQETAPSRNNLNSYVKVSYKHHYTIRLGSQILVIDTNDIAYFYSNEKSTYLVTRDGKEYMTDESLVAIGEELDPARFYQISRKCIICMNSIYTISKYFNSRLKVTVSPNNIEPIIVPRDRVQPFLEWLEGA